MPHHMGKAGKFVLGPPKMTSGLWKFLMFGEPRQNCRSLFLSWTSLIIELSIGVGAMAGGRRGGEAAWEGCACSGLTSLWESDDGDGGNTQWSREVGFRDGGSARGGAISRREHCEDRGGGSAVVGRGEHHTAPRIDGGGDRGVQGDGRQGHGGGRGVSLEDFDFGVEAPDLGRSTPASTGKHGVRCLLSFASSFFFFFGGVNSFILYGPPRALAAS